MSTSDRVFECDYLYCDEPRTDGRFCEKHASEYAVIAPKKKPDAHWVPKEQYDALQAERDALRARVQGLEKYVRAVRVNATQNSHWRREADALLAEPAAPQPGEGNAG